MSFPVSVDGAWSGRKSWSKPSNPHCIVAYDHNLAATATTTRVEMSTTPARPNPFHRLNPTSRLARLRPQHGNWAKTPDLSAEALAKVDASPTSSRKTLRRQFVENYDGKKIGNTSFSLNDA